jgi:hypothetical protein
MSHLQISPWLPALAVAVLTLLAVAVRSATLLVGLLVALPKTSRADRPEIFREFTRAVSGRRATYREVGLVPTLGPTPSGATPRRQKARIKARDPEGHC